MENIVAAQGFGAIQDHDTKWANRDAPQFPCNAVNQDFSVQYQCWQMQTSWMLTLKDYNFELVRDECLKVRPDMILVCFKSLGRDAAGFTLRNPQKIAEICSKVPQEKGYYEQCVIGATNVIIDFWGSGLEDQAIELCRALPDMGKNPCYQTLASRLNDVFAKTQERMKVCKNFEADYVVLCRL